MTMRQASCFWVFLTAIVFAVPALAQSGDTGAGDAAGEAESITVTTVLATGEFTNRNKRSLRGTWTVRYSPEGDRVLVFEEGFRAPWGPDLKVFLSPLPPEQVTGGNATDGSLDLGDLKHRKKPSEYVIPDGVVLEDYASVVVHCEAFSALWGAGPILFTDAAVPVADAEEPQP